MKEKISVVIPVYNVEKYLSRCLDSVINNSYKNLEIICIDDESPDNSLNILKEYSKKDSRMRIISQKNGGLSSARNAGIKKSNGEYITFLDSDDWVHPQYFEILFNEINKSKADAVLCGFSQVKKYDNEFIDYLKTGYEDKVSLISADMLFKEKKYKMFKVYACGVLYRRDLIYHLFPEGVKVIDDNIFNLINLPHYHKISIVKLPIYYYFCNENSIMHTYGCEDAFNGVIWACRFLEEKNDNNIKVLYEMVDFIYKRIIFYRYMFTLSNDKKCAFQKAEKCYKKIIYFNEYIPFYKRWVYRFLYSNPQIYYIYKKVKNKEPNSFFSLADGK